MVLHTWNPSPSEVEARDQGFRGSLGYTVSLGQAWAT